MPPFVGAAVNVRDCPLQVGFEPDVNAMDTEGVVGAETDMVMLFEVALAVLVQEALDVITQVTTCPFVSELDVYVGLLVPTLLPFTFH